MATITIGEFAELLGSLTDDVKEIPFPIDFKDASPEDMAYIDEYNKMLANGHYYNAIQYRAAHPELECFIWDANKMNILQSLVLTIHSALGIKYNNEFSELNADNVQEAIDELVEKVNDCFQSVSDGKKLVASAITDKKITTDANATFSTMAENIRKISTGSGNAYPGNVIEGKTFTNDNGTHIGTMPVFSKRSVRTTSYNLENTKKNVIFNIPSDGFYNTESKLYIPFSNLANLIGLTADKIIKGNSILGISGTASPAPENQKSSKSTYLGKIKNKTDWSGTFLFDTPFATAPSSVTASITTDYPNLKTVEKQTVSNISKTGFKLDFTTADYGTETIPTFSVSWSASV